MSYEDVPFRLAEVRARIAAAARGAGRDPDTVRLVAVTKRHPAEAVRAAYDAGQRDFGENYVQELVEKRAALGALADLRWHLIGHLQRNKAAPAAEAAATIHTVDSAKLVDAVARRATHPIDVLIEVNGSGEPQKSGIAPAALGALIDAITNQVQAAQHLVLRGLMTVPPVTAEAEAEGARPYFRALAALRDAHGGVARLPELSMGMTADLEVAVEEGATIVRIGTAIFGQRRV